MAQRKWQWNGALSLVLGSSLVAACSAPQEPPGQEPPEDTGDEVITQAVPPPPIDGGTLIVDRTSKLAIAADPDRDRIWVVDTAYQTAYAPHLAAEIALDPGDQPGRLVEDGAGLVHVVLRGAGAIATVDPVAGEVKDRRPVCAAPRGIAYDESADALIVACAGGELVTLPAASGPATRTLHLDDDLRDVVITGDRVLVSRFRTAEVLVLDQEGAEIQRLVPQIASFRRPTVAWRMAPAPDGALMVYQMALAKPVNTDKPDAYGDTGDGPILMPGVSKIVDGTPGEFYLVAVNAPDSAALPVDIAMSPDRDRIAMPSAGTASTWQMPGTSQAEGLSRFPCGGGDLGARCQPVAVAYDADGRLVVQSREPPMVMGVLLPGESRRDTGHDLFHESPNGTVSCASCHPGGLEDGHVWMLDGGEPRRTPPLAGGISGTAPFHWVGDLADMGALMNTVFVGRMGGEEQDAAHLTALTRWMDDLPALPAPAVTDEPAVARGAALFESAEVGCATCHSGPHLTNNQTVDVGTGDSFQVPRLTGLRWRAPYMHDGCAATLLDRFGPCGGGDLHGHTSQLDQGQLSDLIAYMNTF